LVGSGVKVKLVESRAARADKGAPVELEPAPGTASSEDAGVAAALSAPSSGEMGEFCDGKEGASDDTVED
jgi:hypothetical protein